MSAVSEPDTTVVGRREAKVSAVWAVATLVVVALLTRPAWELSAWSVLEAVRCAVDVFLVAAGAWMLARGDHVGNGVLLVAAGLADVVASTAWDVGPASLIAWQFGPVTVCAVAWLLLRYPEDRLDDGWARLFIGVLLAWAVGGRVLESLLWDPSWSGYDGPAWWPRLNQSLDLHTSVGIGYWALQPVLALCFLPLYVRHRRRVGGLGRRQTAPLLVAVAVGVLLWGAVIPWAWLVSAPWTSADPTLVTVVDLAGPIAFLVACACLLWAVALRRLERARVVELLRPGVAHTPAQLQGALRSALDDPEVVLLFSEAGRWVDVDGISVTHADDLDLRVLGNPDDPIAAVRVSDTTARHQELLAATLEVARLSLENARLQAVAMAQLAEVRASRERLAEFEAEQRRRFERDLHDGAQQRLLAISAGLARVRAISDDPTVLTSLDEVRDDVRTTLRELRDLAHGLHPAVLTQSGLAPAVASAIERLPLSVSSDVVEERFAPTLEATAYYVVCEGLANALKHARAGHALVSVRRTDEALVVSVSDDGRGGAVVATQGGLAGLRERVAAVGGGLEVVSSAAVGTRIQATLPIPVTP